LVALLILQCFNVEASGLTFRQYRTSVTPEASETLQDRCYYQLLLPVASHEIGLLLAQHCRSKEREDMDVVPEHGIGRARFTASSLTVPTMLTARPDLTSTFRNIEEKALRLPLSFKIEPRIAA
jgi:hypothetical protein